MGQKKNLLYPNNHNQKEWQQGSLIEIEISDLSNSGDGVGKYQGKAVFVPDTVTGDRVTVRLVNVKPQYAYAKLHQLLQPSPHRIRPRCIVANKCGGCQWQHIDYNYQLAAKTEGVIQTLRRIGGFSEPKVAEIIPSSDSLGYRNKATYPLGRSTTGKLQAGYYRKGSHQLINLNQCPIQDSRLDPILAEIKQDIQQQGWSTYNEKKHRGQLRHLSLRIGRNTGEMLITLVSTNKQLKGISDLAKVWLKRYPSLVGINLNHNPKKTNVIFGEETECIAGRSYLAEIFADLKLQLRADTFFQINTKTTEKLLKLLIDRLKLRGNEILIDAYCGIGTFTLPLAKKVETAIGIEVQPQAIEQALFNAKLNNINNVSFHVGKVENILPNLTVKPDLVILDPPRKGCDLILCETLLRTLPSRLIYISCQPATLARDLKLLISKGNYELTSIQPIDFFPQTAHVECIADLRCIS